MRKMIWLATACICCGVTAAEVSAKLQSPASAMSSRAQYAPPPMHLFGIQFAPSQVAAGQQPTFANGERGLTMQAAIAVAMGHTVGAHNNVLLPNVQVSATFGMFSDDQYAHVSASGQLELK